MCDDLLKIDIDIDILYVQGASSSSLVTDDLAVVSTGCTTPILEEVTNRVLNIVADLKDHNSLELSINKTRKAKSEIERAYAYKSISRCDT